MARPVVSNPKPGVARMRLARERRRRGEVIGMVLLPHAAVTALAEQGYLVGDASDANAVSMALGRFLGATLMKVPT